MKGLDWPSERYIRFYCRDTASWMVLGWEAQALYPQIRRKCDRAGVLDLGDELKCEALAAILPKWPPGAVERGLEQLISKGWVEYNKRLNWLYLADFEDSESAKMTSAQRSREYRSKLAAEKRIVASRDETIADGDVSSPEGTRGDAAGHAGTRRDSVPSPPLPSPPNPSLPNPTPSEAAGAAGDNDKPEKPPNPTQEISDLLGGLVARGVENAHALWKARMDNTDKRKKPNTHRQAHQIRKLTKGLENGKTVADVVDMLEAMADGGWSGFRWSYDTGAGGRGRREPRIAKQFRAIVEPVDEPELDIPARLDCLAASLPPNLNAVAVQVHQMKGDAETIEQDLAELDREVVRQVTDELQPAEVEAVDRELADSLASMAQRLPAGELERATVRLREEILRRRMKLPVLSIFSPEAIA